MKPVIKVILSGVVSSIAGFFFLMWGISDFVILFDWPPSLIFIIPGIVAGILMLVCVGTYLISQKKNTLFNPKTIYHCSECGTMIKLEAKSCEKCGSENSNRLEALVKLTVLENNVEEHKTEILERSQSKKRRTARDKKLEKMNLELLVSNAEKVKKRKFQLIIGNTLEEKIKWAKTQYEKGMLIQDIADAIGETMITAKKYIDS